MPGLLLSHIYRSDIYNGGPARLTGSAAKKSVTGKYKVLLFKRPHMRVIRSTYSDDSGFFIFENLAVDARMYVAMCMDDALASELVNAQVFDFCTPEIAP